MSAPGTNFKNGVFSMGMPVSGGGMMIPTMGGLGAAKAYFVDPANGSDGNDGLTMTTALDSVSAAYAKTVDTQGDVIYLMNDGNASGTSREDATITWSNDNTHLVGLCAPTMISQRARISPNTSGVNAIVTPQLTVSGNGNIFSNISLFEGDDQDGTASECVRVTGSRNYFHNVAMMNMGSANSGDEANSCNLKISGGQENTFDGCYIGLDTIARSTTNANVELVSAATRNIFRDCVFPAFADNAGVLWVKIDGAGDIDRFVIFKNCLFYNAIGSTGTTMTAGLNVHASAGGLVILQGCAQVGATEWVGSTNANVYIDMPTPDGVGPAGGTMVSFST
jgi:hypothetical protein